MWEDLEGWTDRYDPVEVGQELTDAQWSAFEQTLTASVEFVAAAGPHANTVRVTPWRAREGVTGHVAFLHLRSGPASAPVDRGRHHRRAPCCRSDHLRAAHPQRDCCSRAC